MDQFIDQFDFGVDILLQKIVKHDKTRRKRNSERDKHKIPALLEVEIHQRDRQADCEGGN